MRIACCTWQSTPGCLSTSTPANKPLRNLLEFEPRSAKACNGHSSSGIEDKNAQWTLDQQSAKRRECWTELLCTDELESSGGGSALVLALSGLILRHRCLDYMKPSHRCRLCPEGNVCSCCKSLRKACRAAPIRVASRRHAKSSLDFGALL